MCLSLANGANLAEAKVVAAEVLSSSVLCILSYASISFSLRVCLAMYCRLGRLHAHLRLCVCDHQHSLGSQHPN